MGSIFRAGQTGKLNFQSIAVVLVIVCSVILVGWALLVVSTVSQIPANDFVALPGMPFSTQGSKVTFDSVAGVSRNGLSIGVRGYLQTDSGAPVAGAKVYLTYYLQGSYRTQVVTTRQDGSFTALFPMNWTGWLPLTLTYFGDGQHQGARQGESVAGEGPY